MDDVELESSSSFSASSASNINALSSSLLSGLVRAFFSLLRRLLRSFRVIGLGSFGSSSLGKIFRSIVLRPLNNRSLSSSSWSISSSEARRVRSSSDSEDREDAISSFDHAKC